MSKSFKFSFSQHTILSAYALTKAINGMEYMEETYEKSFIDKMEQSIKQQIKEDK